MRLYSIVVIKADIDIKAIVEILQLTAAISASPSKIETGLDVPTMSKYMDAIHIMAYDLHGSWESTADHHAPLYARPWDTEQLNCDFSVDLLIKLGAPSTKLVLGMPTYGRSFTLKNGNGNKEPPLAAVGNGAQAGPITKQAGYLGYQEICVNIKENGWTQVNIKPRKPRGKICELSINS